jgi:ferredoxin-type protein NapF
LLGICSRSARLSKHVSNECTNCKLCEKVCPTGAIEKETWKDREAECIKCYICQDECPVDAIQYSFKSKPARLTTIDLGKRKFITASALGLSAGIVARQSADLRNRPNHLIRPPGALPENEFLARCTRCAECVKVCPTRVIQPQGLEQGLAGVFAPALKMRLAGCGQDCNICGKICPTQALREIDSEEKKYAKLGTAAIDQSRCLVYAWGKTCQICDEACPYNAIIFHTVNDKRVPIVVPSRCNGCGWCEAGCPVLGESAIKVDPSGEIRLRQGSYKEEAQSRGIDLSAKDELENTPETKENGSE